ncbi:MAG: GspE/PulE family protein [Pseudomonadota bacterium]
MNARLPAGVLARADFPMLRLVHIHRLEPAFDCLPLAEAYQRRCALFRHEGRFIAVREDPLAVDLQHWVEKCAAEDVEWYLVTPQDLTDWLNKQAEVSSTLHDILHKAKVGAGKTAQAQPLADVLPMHGMRPAVSRDTHSMAQLVQANLNDALQLGASDIHFEAASRGLVVRYRIDGVLETVCEAGGREVAAQTLAYLKTLVGLDGTAWRVPQETRSVVRVNGRRIDVRLSLMPSMHGEDAVLSILEKRRLVPAGEVLGIDQLGFTSVDRAQLRSLATQPYGLVLVTGPGSCGKTTTLYGMLSEINDGRDKIVTVENPIEHELPGILQVAATDYKDTGMAGALRAVLAHDPDRIMIGDIHDAETAELALQSAQEGHLVFAAVKGNHAFDVFSRFARFGIDPEELTGALNGVVSQRLLRTVCPHCAEPVVPTTRELAALNLPPEAAIGGFRRGAGCGECRTTGYHSRRAVAEILLLDDRLRTLIARRAPLVEITAEAQRQGMQSLRDAALQLARAGLTTIEEVARVTRQG